ncbi:MAG: glycosyl transferase, group 1 [Pedosphaera sp.]|nr:glycosyl transferase, group 1 [Pedosphaera sp.]
MKIAYFTHQYFPRHIGGTEVYLRGLARRAAASGHEVLIITYHESPSDNPRDFGVHRTEVDGLPVLEIHYNLSLAPQPALYEYNNPFIANLVRQELETFAPDLVHALHTMKLSGAVLESCYALGIPAIVTMCDFWYICPRHTLLKWDGSVCHGPRHPFSCVKCLQHTHGFASQKLYDRRKPFSRPQRENWTAFVRDVGAVRKRKGYLKQTVLQANRILALSSFQKKMLVKNGFPAKRIEVCEHGLETAELASNTPQRNGAVRFGFIGSLVSHKGAHILIEALKKVPELKAKCFLHGPVREHDAYTRDLVALARGDKRIEFRGGFSPHQLGAILQETDIFVMPSLWYENEPLVVKAALHMGVPIIASDIGSLPGMLGQGTKSWLVKPGNAAALAEALQTAVRDFDKLDIRPSPIKSMDRHAPEIFAIYEEEKQKI